VVRNWVFAHGVRWSNFKHGCVYEVIKTVDDRTFVVSVYSPSSSVVTDDDVITHGVDPKWLGTRLGWLLNVTTDEAFRGNSR
jgi:hypothetical protein